MATRLPRNIKGATLARRLGKLGYSISRQVGSHLRLTTQQDGEHHVTIPRHSPIRVGTLHAILKEVALHHKFSLEELIEILDM